MIQNMNEENEKIGDWVVYKNNQLIAFNKPVTLPVQHVGEAKSLLDLAEIYTKQKLHLIHRLDQPASGVILMAKTHTALVSLNEQFKKRKVEKSYLAVVKEKPPEKEGTLIHYLKKLHRNNKSIVFSEPKVGAKRAELHYQLIDSIDNYHLLKIKLITGRHHQIRAQLSAIGCPIKGDVKYGFRRNNLNRSIHLHAWKLAFQHPISKEQVTLIAEVPEDPVWSAFTIPDKV